MSEQSEQYRDAVEGGGWLVLEHCTAPPGMPASLMLVKHPDYSTLHALERRPGLLHLVGDFMRPGVPEFANELELIYFPPDSPRNDQFEQRLVLWSDRLWQLVTIPAKCRRFADRVCQRQGLRVANGVPTAITFPAEMKIQYFPMKGPTVWTIETVHTGDRRATLLEDAGIPRAERDARMREIHESFNRKDGRN